MTTNYRRGADFERKVMDVLRQHGFRCVRSAGSHSPADIVAWQMDWPCEIWLVQCKADGKFPAADRERLLDWTHQDMLPVLAAKAGRGTVEFTYVAQCPENDEILGLDDSLRGVEGAADGE